LIAIVVDFGEYIDVNCKESIVGDYDLNYAASDYDL
jgi:hypothetical protein